MSPTREASQVDASFQARIESKLDDIASKLEVLSGEVIERRTFCVAEHRRLDERASEDRARIIALERASQKVAHDASWAKGAGWALLKVAAVAGGGGAAAAAALKLLGGG